MFNLYQSNDFNVLKKTLIELLFNNRYKNYLLKEIIIIPNYNISFNIKLYISRYLGICANYKFYLLDQFIDWIFQIFIPRKYNIDYFNKFNLIWIIMSILPKLIDLYEFHIIKKYLSYDNKKSKLFSLAVVLADLYNKYLVYRVDMIHYWENIKSVDELDIHHKWQCLLWKEIIYYIYIKDNCVLHKAQMYYVFINIINNNLKISSFLKHLPQDIYLFHISYIPPVYLHVLELLSKYINIHYFIINPSKLYWYDQSFFQVFFSEKNKFVYKTVLSHKNILFPDNYLNLRIINLLLLNYGKFLSNYLYLLDHFCINNILIFVKKTPKTLLQIIQHDILYNKIHDISNNKNNNEKNKRYISYKDHSITINACNGYLREVEILYDYIIYLLLHKKYHVNDIIVVVNNLSLYVNYIKAIFDYSIYRKYLSYVILEKENEIQLNILNNFIQILNLPNIELNISSLKNILLNKYILDKFHINDDELKIILIIISDIQIINLINQEYNFDKIDYFTWEHTIKCILLGYAMDTDIIVWNNIKPYYYINNMYYNDIIEKFIKLVYLLLYYKLMLSKKYIFSVWIDIGKAILSDFFVTKLLIKYPVITNKILDMLIINYNYSSYSSLITNTLFINIILIYLKPHKENKLLSINKINFCTFKSVHGIKKKVICLIGMNNTYPKNIYINDINLMLNKSYWTDKDPVDWDKYIFLEFLISAQERLYISYINFSFITYKQCLPSFVIKNIIDYILSNFLYIKNKFHILVKSKILVLSNIYYLPSIVVYDIINFSNKLIYYGSFCYEWCLNIYVDVQVQKYLYKYILVNNKIIITLYLKNLCLFWMHPINYYCFYILKINFYINKRIHINNEWLNINKYKFYLLKYKLILLILNDKISLDNINYFWYFHNIIPLKNLGKLVWDKEKNKFFTLVKLVLIQYKYIKKYRFTYVSKLFNITGTFLCGSANKIGVIKWLPKKINVLDILCFFFEHLLYCLLGGNYNSYLYTYDHILLFPYININKAYTIIYKYILAYHKGIVYPFFFLPQTSNMWILSAYNIYNKLKLNKYLLSFVYKKILTSLYGSIYYIGELNEINIYKLRNYLNKYIDSAYVIKYAEKWLLQLIFNCNIKKINFHK